MLDLKEAIELQAIREENLDLEDDKQLLSNLISKQGLKEAIKEARVELRKKQDYSVREEMQALFKGLLGYKELN